VNVYSVPFVSPATAHGELVQLVEWMLPGLEVAVYPVIASPPFDAGAEKLTVADELPGDATTLVGGPGWMALTVKLRACEAGGCVVLPVSFALIVQVPALTKVAVPPEVIVHTDWVVDVKVTGCPEVDVAVNVGDVPKF
jgi:hypothetical protein